LLEMPVVGESLGQPSLAHGLHRNTVDQAVSFVRAGTVELQTGQKGFPALGDHSNRRARQNALPAFRSLPAQRLAGSRKKGEVFRQHFVGGHNARARALGCESHNSLVCAVGVIRQRNLVEGVGKNNGHSAFLGQP
jgi:hypothetical protein